MYNTHTRRISLGSFFVFRYSEWLDDMHANQVPSVDKLKSKIYTRHTAQNNAIIFRVLYFVWCRLLA